MRTPNLGYGLIATVVAALVVASLRLTLHERNETSTQPLRRITIAQAGDFFLYAPIYVAVDADFFRRQGLDVNIVSTGGDEKTWAAVVSGSAAFGVADPTFVAVSAQRGQPGLVVASIVNGVPFWGISFHKEIAPFANLKQLQGHTVATFPSPSTAYVLQEQMFKDAGLPVRIQQGAFGTLLSMLNAGRADIALELEPNVSQAVARGAHVVYSLASEYGEFAMTGLSTTAKVSADRPLVSSVTCALQHALDFIRERPDSSLILLRARFPDVDSAVAAASLTRVTEESVIPCSLVLKPTAWHKAVALRLRSGDLEVTPVYEGFVDTTFAAEAERDCRLTRSQ